VYREVHGLASFRTTKRGAIYPRPNFSAVLTTCPKSSIGPVVYCVCAIRDSRIEYTGAEGPRRSSCDLPRGSGGS
jgi:hypothetical protein